MEAHTSFFSLWCLCPLCSHTWTGLLFDSSEIPHPPLETGSQGSLSGFPDIPRELYCLTLGPRCIFFLEPNSPDQVLSSFDNFILNMPTSVICIFQLRACCITGMNKCCIKWLNTYVQFEKFIYRNLRSKKGLVCGYQGIDLGAATGEYLALEMVLEPKLTIMGLIILCTDICGDFLKIPEDMGKMSKWLHLNKFKSNQENQIPGLGFFFFSLNWFIQWMTELHSEVGPISIL